MAKFIVRFEAEPEDGESIDDIIEVAEQTLMGEGFSNIECTENR